MRSFQHVLVLLFALFAFALADDAQSYDATVYLTSTLYRVSTITLSGTPTASVQNQTSTIQATYPVSTAAYPTNGTANPTGTVPSGTGSYVPSATPPPFQGAASSVNANALIALVAAALGFMAL